jgi:aminoglycoside phosphotransferase (APT) family kinase protein
VSEQPHTLSSRPALSIDDVRALVTNQFGAIAESVRELGGGSWSQCFAFDARADARRLIIKFSAHDEDLVTDRLASEFNQPGLPVPRIHRQGQALGFGYTVADRADGIPLETVGAEQWRALVPQLASALRTMFTETRLVGDGWGGWDDERRGGHSTWPDFLRAATTDPGTGRVAGWLPKLDAVPGTRALFDATVARIDEILRDNPAAAEPPRALLHCDLLYRNVHVDVSTDPLRPRLSGIFDWGCSVYGDPLYELGWFEFWHPWYPQLEPKPLFAAVSHDTPEWDPRINPARWEVALLHIGATHLAYQAFADLHDDLAATAQRLRDITSRPRPKWGPSAPTRA